MKPIGTITNYFPFLEEETQNILSDIMEKASDYYDFVLRLGNMVCDEDVSSELAYFTAVHVFFVREKPLQERLKEKYEDRPEILVWTFPLTGAAESELYRDEAKALLSKVFSTKPPDWMLIDLLFRVDSHFNRTPSESAEMLKQVESILDRNQDLACFETYRHHLRTNIAESEGESVKTLLGYQRGIEIARRFDDVLWLAILTGGLGHFLRNHDATEAMHYTEESNRLSMSLGVPRYMGMARHRMGLIYLVRGEYDMAIECQFAHIEAYYHETGPSSSLAAAISSFYCDIEDGKQALHWANESFRIAGGKGECMMHAIKSRALILLDNLSAADEHVNILHKQSLQTASDNNHLLYLYSRGLYEFTSGMSSDALQTLNEALSLAEILNIQIMINRLLIALTQTEIQLADEAGDEDSSGPWMVRLESHARKKDYPGIQMHAALLRAQFFVKQRRNEEAKEVLCNALEILDSPTVKTLRTKIQKMLDALVIA
jgi:tetratricopeptide (TPR) repeat protein